MKRTKQNKVSDASTRSIYGVADNQQYIIDKVPELGILKSLGIIKDATIHKQKTYKLGGPVLLMVESSEIAIGKDIAKSIMVRW